MGKTHITIHVRLVDSPEPVPDTPLPRAGYLCMGLITQAGLRMRARGTAPPPNGLTMTTILVAGFTGYESESGTASVPDLIRDRKLKGPKP